MTQQTIHDESLPQPSGYVHGVLSSAPRHLFISGQIALDADGNVVGVGEIVAQFAQAIANVGRVLEAAGAQPTDVVKLNIFVRDVETYLKNSKKIGEAYRSVFGKHFPAMTIVEINRLVHDDGLVEIEGVAAMGS